MLWIAVISLFFIYYTYSHLPIKDYRAYAVGKSIPEQMVLPEGAVPDIYSNIFVYRDTISNTTTEFYDTDGNTGAKEGYYLKDAEGNYIKISEEKIPWNIPSNKFVNRETKLIKTGDKTAINDFTITAEDGNNYSQDFFNEDAFVFLFISYDINKAKDRAIKKINTFVDQCSSDGNNMIGLTSSGYNAIEDYKIKNQLMLDFYTCDAITLKTIVRANPGILLMKKGTILGKWNANDLPDYESVKKDYLK